MTLGLALPQGPLTAGGGRPSLSSSQAGPRAPPSFLPLSMALIYTPPPGPTPISKPCSCACPACAHSLGFKNWAIGGSVLSTLNLVIPGGISQRVDACGPGLCGTTSAGLLWVRFVGCRSCLLRGTRGLRGWTEVAQALPAQQDPASP